MHFRDNHVASSSLLLGHQRSCSGNLIAGTSLVLFDLLHSVVNLYLQFDVAPKELLDLSIVADPIAVGLHRDRI